MTPPTVTETIRGRLPLNRLAFSNRYGEAL